MKGKKKETMGPYLGEGVFQKTKSFREARRIPNLGGGKKVTSHAWREKGRGLRRCPRVRGGAESIRQKSGVGSLPVRGTEPSG